jgi:hypothetical protein
MMKRRRVLMIGGHMDGKWHTHEGGPIVRVMKPLRVSMDVGRRESDARVDMPGYEQYHLEHVALYGQGIWVGLHEGTIDRLSLERLGPPEAHVVMILRAILQRDVATELGL